MFQQINISTNLKDLQPVWNFVLTCIDFLGKIILRESVHDYVGLILRGTFMEMMILTEILRNNGLKVTPQRLAVHEVLENGNDHPNAETIYNKLHRRYPTMSLATVYKTLEVMVRIGLIKQINLGEDSFRYDARTVNHTHVRCVCCGAVQDVFDVDDSEIMASVARKTSFAINDRQLCFYGKCPACQQGNLN